MTNGYEKKTYCENLTLYCSIRLLIIHIAVVLGRIIKIEFSVGTRVISQHFGFIFFQHVIYVQYIRYAVVLSFILLLVRTALSLSCSALSEGMLNKNVSYLQQNNAGRHTMDEPGDWSLLYHQKYKAFAVT